MFSTTVLKESTENSELIWLQCYGTFAKVLLWFIFLSSDSLRVFYLSSNLHCNSEKLLVVSKILFKC